MSRSLADVGEVTVTGPFNGTFSFLLSLAPPEARPSPNNV